MWVWILITFVFWVWSIYNIVSSSHERSSLDRDRGAFESYKTTEAARAKEKLHAELASQRDAFFAETKAQHESFMEEISRQRQRAVREFEAVRQLQASELSSLYRRLSNARAEAKTLDDQRRLIETAKSNLTALPYWAGIMADFETHGIDVLATSLDWGESIARAQKVKSIREIRKEAASIIAQCKEAQYQLDYLLKMFPSLEDFLETDYRDLPIIDDTLLSDEKHDNVRNYLSKEEYSQLSETARNQLALDRYLKSHRKTKWQVGRDYELFVGYNFTLNGFSVDYFGSYNGIDDLGRDLIAKKDSSVLVIQCKYWSSKKEIHENHICQLHGTVVSYSLENGLPPHLVSGVLVTNISLSETAKRFAQTLGITIVENFPIGEYPCIKCNINRSSAGEITKIYHLPFDQQYDSCKIDSPGEFFAMTVEEAEASGFRRAFRWHTKHEQ